MLQLLHATKTLLWNANPAAARRTWADPARFCRTGWNISYVTSIRSKATRGPLTAPVLLGLAQAFSVNLADFGQEDTDRLIGDLRQALADPVFSGLLPNTQDLKTIAANTPWFAHAFLSLHLAFRRANERTQILDQAFSSERTETERDPGALAPYEEVRDFLHYRGNYLDRLDRSAESLAEDIIVGESVHGTHLADYLFKQHGIRVESEKVDPSSLLHSPSRPRRARALAARRHRSCEQGLSHRPSDRPDRTGKRDRARSLPAASFRANGAATITRIALGNYFAGALVMPYERFLNAARNLRYDVERLCTMFGASFEQVGHRLSTLQRPGDRGVPFYFVRVDRAGNILKRHSSTRFQFARFGGTCPLWNVHEAFSAGDRTLVQIAEMPDGVRYLSVARAATKSGGSHLAPPRHFALGIGCEISYAQDVVYADGIDIKTAPVTKIGVSCRICERGDCPQRAAPPIDRPLIVDPDRRDFVPFRFS